MVIVTNLVFTNNWYSELTSPVLYGELLIGEALLVVSLTTACVLNF